jgi:signal peptide peptidase SppA
MRKKKQADMHSPHLISSILKGKWAIELGYGLAQGPVIANLLNQYVDFEKQEPDPMSAFAIAPAADIKRARYSYWDGFERAPSGSIAVIKLKNTLMKDDQYCGPVGMATIGEIIKAAGAHENIAGIVLHIDSPGGTVDGTEALANIVKSIEKPVVTFVDGLMASAAFWVGSQADEIIASTDTDEIGSVGVLLSFADLQPYWESLGIKFHKLVASTSPDKIKIWEDLRDGKYDTYIKEVLDPLDEKFMNTIRENLPNIEDKHLTGKVFFARDLMGIVVDSIGTLDDAITRASELAQERNSKEDQNQAIDEGKSVSEIAEEFEIKSEKKETSTEAENNQKNNLLNMKQFKNVNAALGVEALESVDGVVSLNEEQLEALDNALGKNNSEELQTQLDAANETVKQHKATISDRDATIVEKDSDLAEKDAEIARLKGKAANDTATAKTEGDDKDLNKGNTKTVVSDDDDFETAVQKVSDEYLKKY